MTYLFLWFSPRHGHCYGFYIIPGSEGRKDPVAALYTHMEIPPKCIFYDHAFSLSEYVKSRESGFFKNTRVFHDVFHGFTHKCLTSFRYADLNCFSQVNTSICEQFNSYIQIIKSGLNQGFRNSLERWGVPRGGGGGAPGATNSSPQRADGEFLWGRNSFIRW